MGMFEVRGPQFGELDAATMDCVVGKARQLVHRHGSSHCTTGRSVVVLVALCWVLQSLYRVTPSELLDLIDDLLRSRHLQLQHRPALQAAVQALGCRQPTSCRSPVGNQT
jgi:predicted nucleic-acid-binding protein